MIGSAPTYTVQARSRGGTQRTILLRPARQEEVWQVARVYNGVIDPLYELECKVNGKQILARLQKDPLSVLVACFEDTPVGLINVVKRRLKDEYAIPRTHQELTDNETLASTQPEEGNTWFCQWVAVIGDARGYKANIGQMNRSIGQALAWWVKELALQHGRVQHMYAYTRPAGLRNYVEQKVGTLVFEVDEENRTLKTSTLDWQPILTTVDGVYFPSYERYIVTYQEYLEREEDPDPVLNFHRLNGAVILPRSFMPYAQIYDRNGLGLRLLGRYF